MERGCRIARIALGTLTFALVHGACLVGFEDYPASSAGAAGSGGATSDGSSGGASGAAGAAGGAGSAGCAGGEVDSVRTFGAASNESVSGLTATSTGAAVGGHHDGAFDVDGNVIPHSGGTGPDVFALSLHADGSLRWAIGHGSTVSSEFVLDVASDGAGSVFLVGGYDNGAAQLGKGPLAFVGSMEVFVAKYEAADGAPIWTHGFAETGHQIGQAIAVDASGNALVAINASAPIDVGTGLLDAKNKDVVIAKYDTTGAGTAVWSQVFGDDKDQTVTDIGTDSSDAVYFVGRYQGAMIGLDLLDTQGDDDLFVAKLDAAGNLVWSTAIGGPQKQQAEGVAIGNDGVFVVGSFAGLLPGSSPPLSASGLTLDALVVKLSPSGEILWTRSLGGDVGDDVATAVIALADGGAVVLGYFWGTADFGGAPLVSDGDEDLFVVRVDSTGNVVWRRRFGNSGQNKYAELSWGNWGGSGRVLVGLSFRGTLDLGTGPLSSSGTESDGLIASICP